MDILNRRARTTPTKSDATDRLFTASPLRLTWLRFRKHRVATISLVLLSAAYIISLVPGFFATQDPRETDSTTLFAPPHTIHLVDPTTGEVGLFIYGYTSSRDPKTFRPIYEIDPTQKYPLGLFVSGDPYQIVGSLESDVHLFGAEGTRIHLFGTDDLGRDVFSRVIFAGRISLFIGLTGVAFSFLLGCLLGGLSGYYGGWVDTLIQRIIELTTSIPTIPLWMALSASLPRNWSPEQIYFAITLILSLRGWAGIARVVRGQLLEIRHEDFVTAARLAGRSEAAIISKHLIPSVFSYLIVALTLAIPGMILGETALSFIGLGLRPPTISLGVLLQEAQNIRTIALHPWLMIPAVYVIAVVICFNFIGDGLRDAADPYAD